MPSYKTQSSGRLGGRRFINSSGARLGGGGQSEKRLYRRGRLQQECACIDISTNDTGPLQNAAPQDHVSTRGSCAFQYIGIDSSRKAISFCKWLIGLDDARAL